MLMQVRLKNPSSQDLHGVTNSDLKTINVLCNNFVIVAGRECNQHRCTCNPNNLRRKLWIFLEDPSSSMLARVIA